MSRNHWKLYLLACWLGLGVGSIFSQPARSASAPGGELKMVVILSRHGVRSPTWTLDRLNSYSSQPWPAFSVVPGNLTDRGFTLIRQFAAYDRTALSAQGLFPATGCAASASTYIWADTDQRTVATGKAFAEGLFPGCAPEVHSLAPGDNDPLFHPLAGSVTPAQTDAAYAAVKQRMTATPEVSARLLEMQRILRGCEPRLDCSAAKQPATVLLDTPVAVVRGKGDHIVDVQGPLPTASTFSEDFLLEYADGLPMASVGWGHVDEAELRRLLELHTAYFELIHRTMPIAQIEASPMLRGIAATLQQGVEGKPVAGAKGPVGEKLVILAGHDTNLAGVASLLGIHWTLDGRSDDTPPGTELIFELWQDAAGAYSVKVDVAAQTLEQLRNPSALNPANPPAMQELTPRGCAEASRSCSWKEFLQLTQ